MVQLGIRAVPVCTHQTIISLFVFPQGGHTEGTGLGWDRVTEPTQPLNSKALLPGLELLR